MNQPVHNVSGDFYESAVLAADDRGLSRMSGAAPHGNSSSKLTYIPRASNKEGGSNDNSNENRKFRRDFFRTVNNRGEGLGTVYLWWEAPASVGGNHSEAVSEANLKRKSWGSRAWDMIAGKGQVRKGNQYVADGKSLGVSDDDMAAIEYALDHDLLSKFPKNIAWLEYGSGGHTGFRKPQQFLTAFGYPEKDGADPSVIVCSATAVDILSRYARESAVDYAEYEVDAFASVGNFMMSDTPLELPTVPEGCTPVIAIFGGTFENPPNIHNGHTQAPKTSAVEYYTRLNRQHGLGSYIVKTYNAEHDPAKIEAKYPREEFEPFLLSFFHRACQEGVIRDPNYDPGQYWEMEPAEFDEEQEAARLNLVCKETHVLPLREMNGLPCDRKIERGHRINIILSHKWEIDTQREILENAGYEIVAHKRDPSRAGGVILAKAVRAPDFDPFG
ncbi:MAG: hypothetical protein EOM26_00415 [Alphaproteobacteria bacterium]|nr:hypothetical protein [Alphaproteobacteria bacterium]